MSATARLAPVSTLWLAGCLAALGALTACAATTAVSPTAGVAGDLGSVVTVAPADRGDPVDLRGQTLDGVPFDVAAYRGHVVVINYWEAQCGPCRSEAAALVEAARRLPSTRFVGLNRSSDSTTSAEAFVRTFRVPYPIVKDTGDQLLALSGTVPPTSLPSTAVLDRNGRVAAVVLGEVTATLLVDLVHDVRSSANDPT
jgi:peroxiredoxin